MRILICDESCSHARSASLHTASGRSDSSFIQDNNYLSAHSFCTHLLKPCTCRSYDILLQGAWSVRNHILVSNNLRQCEDVSKEIRLSMRWRRYEYDAATSEKK
ncbi:unnamed protein product [Clavelina lepadiformis]|uniref:Uncharacterized protein n=1 Tax=Clavelina lepadiformis TaxID=159417 RepID=A0ABP0G857_CLALP